MNKIKYSIIICTYNRADLLESTIKSVIESCQHKECSEVVIIDNNSTDHTSTVVNKFKNEPFVKYFLEVEQGLSHARNRGMLESTGEILVFIDDDVELHSNYFNVISKTFEDEKIDILGGKVLPYKINIPEWLPYNYYYLASIFDLGDKELSVDKLMGANYALRRSATKSIGLYNTNLGRKGTQLSGGEEIDYLSRASNIGLNIMYVPSLVVYHKINNKLSKDYILNYSYLLAKSELIIDKQSSNIKVAIKALKSLLALVVYKVGLLHLTKSKSKTTLQIISAYAKGYLDGLLLDKC